MTVVGIDMSSFAIDIALLDDDTLQATHLSFPLTGRTPFERARSVRSVFPGRGYLEDEGVYLAGIEDPHSRASHTAKALGLVTGALIVLLPPDLTIIQTPPAEWKRLTVGSGAATKDQVSGWARHELGHLFKSWPQDGYDAYAIARAVLRLNTEALERGLVA